MDILNIRRAITPVVCLALMWSFTARAADERVVEPVSAAMADTPSWALFHPHSAASVTMLDELAAQGVEELLAVCVGDGCTPDLVRQVAAEHSWPYRLAYDPSGVVTRDVFGTADVPAVRRASSSRLRQVLDGLARPSLGVPEADVGSQPPSAGLVSTIQPTLGRASSAAQPLSSTLTPPGSAVENLRLGLIVALPLVLVGLGGAAFYVGSRSRTRRRDDPDDDLDEREAIEDFVARHHGRKPIGR